VDYAALNPADRYLAENQYPARPKMPHILGRDGVGTIVAIGLAVRDFKVGSRVMVIRSDVGVDRPGTFAQLVTVPADSIAHIPPGWSDHEAAGAVLVYLTAYQALTQWGNLPPGLVLITGASGGVGVASLQLARALGHATIVLSRSPQKRQKLIQMGAEAAYDPELPQWASQLKTDLAGRRVDLAIDNIGGPGFPDLLDTLGLHGKVSVVGRLAGPVPNFNTASLLFRRLRIGGVAVGSFSTHESHLAWQQIVQLLQKIAAKPIVDRVFEFPQLLDAFAHLASGPMGKVLLKVHGSA
jgi:NADPH2:quinone reductase